MKDLHNWPDNPFDDPHIGIDNLVTFSKDNIVRMTNNNTSGYFTARIAATTTALTAVNTAFQSDQSKLGERKTATQTKQAFRAALPAASAKIHIALQQKYGKKAPQLATFFPHGLDTFNRTRDEQMENVLQDLVTELTTHQTEVGADTVTAATTLLAGWQAVIAPSENAGGAKDAAMLAKRTARANLQLELFKNLLTIAINFPRQPEMVDVYMQQSLLSPHTPSPAPSPTPTPTQAILVTVNSDESFSWKANFTAGKSWLIENAAAAAGPWQNYDTIDGATLQYGTPDETNQWFRVRATDESGNATDTASDAFFLK